MRRLLWIAWLGAALAGPACGAPLPASEPGPVPMDADLPTASLGGFAGDDAAGGMAPARAQLALIRTADLTVTVDAYGNLRDRVEAWLDARGGFVADEQLWGDDEQPTGASLRLRVPAEQLDPLLAWLQGEAHVQRLDSRTTDVTAEWVDLEARLRAHRAGEERMIGLVADRTASLADVLAAERELTRIRGEIEQIEGRRRVLDDQIALATVHLDVSVRAPLLGGEPLSAQVARSFTGSLSLLGSVARGGVLVLVALVPWLVVAAVGTSLLGTLGFGLLRLGRR
ncbi:MAG: DUF4349 domain-containing protein [Myxococcota bacterium]